ncbi:MAG: metallophosphoesterase [Chloroflexi bacterium]|nr:metallophosphoesterase [Chloroflexota bacterium]MCC6893719.1 metallophosphoesterase [Anaerolineae bacterium]
MPEQRLTFVHISDTHISPDMEYGKHHAPYSTQTGARALVRAVNALPFNVDFILHTGDVVYDPVPEAYLTAKDILSELARPVYYLAGNHDKADALQSVLLGRADILEPFYYTFDANGFQIVCMDSNGPAEVPRGNVISQQLEWLDTICSAKDERPLVVAIHHNALPVGSPWLDDYMRITNGATLHQVLLKAKDRLRGVFFGHVHQNIQMYQDGILYTSALSSWNQFMSWPESMDTVADEFSLPGFNVVSMSPTQTFIRRWGFKVE